jgi:hypothetical protein
MASPVVLASRAVASARNRLLVAALLVGAAAALVAHMRLFRFVTDDAFISFVYARNFAEHGQLAFNLGEPVEGYTNFLWTVFLAGWLRVGWQPESASLFWGVTFALATMGVLAWWSRRAWALDEDGDWSPWDALPALLLAAVPGYACWAAGGLETQMFTFFVTLGGALYLSGGERASYGSAVAFGLAALTRPEGNLFFALAMLHRSMFAVVRQRRWLPQRSEVAWVAIYLTLVVPHLLWRHHYYGYWVPNTFYIKSSGGRGTWARGLYYLRRCAEAFLLPALAAIPLLALAAGRRDGPWRLYRYALLVAAVFFAYVVSVGGDFMGLYRFALPVVPLFALAASLGLRALLRVRAWMQAIAVSALLALYAWHDVGVDRAALAIGSDNGIDTPGYLRWYTNDRAAIGRWFGSHAQPDDYAVVGGAGAQVYYSRMRSLDAFGLSDAYIAHRVPAVSNRPGHEKYAPVEYQLAGRPTIITSNYYNIGLAPLVRDDASFWRSRGYHYVSVQIPGLSSPWYTFLKRMDRRVGPLAPLDTELN